MELYERQLELENESIELEVARYNRRRETESEADMAPGKLLIREKIKPLAELIEPVIHRPAGRGKPSLVSQVCGALEAEQVAALTLRAVIGAAASENTVAHLSVRIAIAIEDHLNTAALADAEPGLYRAVLPNVRQWTISHKRLQMIRG